MKQSEIINKLHTGVIIYILFGWTLQSQRELLVLLIPTVQFQFLVNDNQCILTQLEKKFIVNETKEKTNESRVTNVTNGANGANEDNGTNESSVTNEKTKEIVYESFIDEKLKQFNIHIDPHVRERIINLSIYTSFALNYFLM